MSEPRNRHTTRWISDGMCARRDLGMGTHFATVDGDDRVVYCQIGPTRSRQCLRIDGDGNPYEAYDSSGPIVGNNLAALDQRLSRVIEVEVSA